MKKALVILSVSILTILSSCGSKEQETRACCHDKAKCEIADSSKCCAKGKTDECCKGDIICEKKDCHKKAACCEMKKDSTESVVPSTEKSNEDINM